MRTDKKPFKNVFARTMRTAKKPKVLLGVWGPTGGLGIFFTTSVMKFGRTELKRCVSEAKKSSEQRGAVRLSAAPQNRG